MLKQLKSQSKLLLSVWVLGNVNCILDVLISYILPMEACSNQLNKLRLFFRTMTHSYVQYDKPDNVQGQAW